MDAINLSNIPDAAWIGLLIFFIVVGRFMLEGLGKSKSETKKKGK